MKTSFRMICLIVAVSVASSFLAVKFFVPAPHNLTSAETAYDRILRTGTLRCAYALYPPDLIKDPNTGALSGIFYDVMEEVGRRLNLKIDWTEEVGYGVIAEGFATNRYDAFCSAVWPTAERSRAAAFTVPLFYSPVDVFVRADDHRFDNKLDALNDPSISFSGRDGDISATIAAATFPQAKIVSIPQLSDTAQTLDDVVHHKADATINEPGLLYQYLEKNPGTMRILTEDKPIRVSPNGMMIKQDAYQLKAMLDTTLTEMLNSGAIDKILQQYQKQPIFLPVALPYRALSK